MIKEEDHALETYKGLIQISLTGIRTISFLNGGAVIAILAYLGDITKDSPAPDVRVPLIFFVLGLILAGCTALASYLTQLKLFKETHDSTQRGKHEIRLKIGLTCAALSLFAFAVGALWAAFTLTTSPLNSP